MVYTKAGLWILLAGVVVLARQADCLRGSALVAELKNKAKAALLNPTETVEEVVTVEGDAEGGNATNVTVTKTKSLLTGNPQKDYIYDPNLPRELNGYNLTNYPFYNGVPEDIDFKCDDLHDGFYASVPHKCQVYHHCLFGTRYDFLCANYTAFDQRTFICHFVSEVDCDNSPKFYQRNEALYKSASTTSAPIVIPTTPSTTPTPTTAATQRPRRRRPYRRRRPAYEYYYDDQYDDEEYYDDDPPPPRRKTNRKHRPLGGHRQDDGDDYYEGRRDSSRGDSSRADNSRSENARGDVPRAGIARGGGGRGDSEIDSSKDVKPTVRVSGPALGTVYDKPRVPPKIRRPVPISERDKYDYMPKTSDGVPAPTQNPKKHSKPQNNHEEYEDDYYDEEYEDDYVKPPPKRNKDSGGYSSEAAGKPDSRRPSHRHRTRPSSRRRPDRDRYEDDYEEDRSTRPRKRLRYEDPPQPSRGTRVGHRGYSRDEPDPVPADRPGFISSGRYSSGNRKKVEDDRSTTTKKPQSKVVYDDEEEEEEYYDDEEEDGLEDEVGRRNHNAATHSAGSGRRNGDYEPDGERKQVTATSNRKPTGDGYTPKSTLRIDSVSQPSGGIQGKSENEKVSNRQKYETTTSKRFNINERCRNECEDDYSEYSVDDSRQEQRRNNDRDNTKLTNKNDNQRQISERDRQFSSRFRETIGDAKPKLQTYEQTGPGKPSLSLPSYRATTQNPELSQRQKPSLRIKTNSEEPVTPRQQQTSTTEASIDYSEESLASGSKYNNFRSKGRIAPPPSFVNNFKAYSTSEEPLEAPKINNNQEFEQGGSITEESNTSSSGKSFGYPRPFTGLVRRPVKVTTEASTYDNFQDSPRAPQLGMNYRQPSLTNDNDDRSGQNYRRKPEPSQNENGEFNQQKPQFGSSGRRTTKPVEEIRHEDLPQDNKQYYSQATEESPRKPMKPFLSEKPQLNNPSYGGAYRRVKVSAMSTTTPESEMFTSNYENPQSYQDVPPPNPVNSYKRPYNNGRPLINYPVVVEDTTKNDLSVNNPFRRPLKQMVQDNESQLGAKGYNPTSTTSGIGESYIKVEQGVGINFRPSISYFPPKRNKLRIDDTSARGLDQYPKQFNLNEEDQFSKQTPKVEVTAPGPSGPGSDLDSVKVNNYNTNPGFPLNIPEEEYDVTLNDALQPSTLHPTRSLVDYPQNRLKTRDYQSNLGRAPEYVSRGRVAFLVPAASQQYITRVQSVYSPDKQEEPPITARYTDNKENQKGSSVDEEEYEAVVLTASNDHWHNQRRNRPTEWYW